MKRCPRCKNWNQDENLCQVCGLDFTAPYTPPKPLRNWLPAGIVVIIVLLAIAIFAPMMRIASPPAPQSTTTTPQPTPNDVVLKQQERHRFADGLQRMAMAQGKQVWYGVEGTSLTIKSDELLLTDCNTFARSDYGQAAASIGFTSVICRDWGKGELKALLSE